MIALLSKTDYAKVIIAFPFIAVLLWLPAIFLQVEIPILDVPDAPLFNFLIDFLQSKHTSLPALVVALVLTVINTLLLVIINLRYSICSTKSALQGVFFLLFSSSLLALQQFHSAIIGVFFFIISMIKILDFDRKGGAISNSFEAAFYLSFGSLFYFNTLVFTPIVWIGLALMRNFFWREWFVVFFGTITPYLLFFSFYYGFTGEISTVWNQTVECVLYKAGWNFEMLNMVQKIMIGGWILLLIQALLFSWKQKLKIKQRNSFNLLIASLFIGIFVYIFLGSTSFEVLVFIAFPMSYIVSNFLINSKRVIVKEIIFFLLFGLVIAGLVVSF